jgi:cobalamin biosynthesis Mg chelatase CobN
MAHILPTGRNFYSVDPRSVPSQSAWRVGSNWREVLARHHRESGDYPEAWPSASGAPAPCAPMATMLRRSCR